MPAIAHLFGPRLPVSGAGGVGEELPCRGHCIPCVRPPSQQNESWPPWSEPIGRFGVCLRDQLVRPVDNSPMRAPFGPRPISIFFKFNDAQ